jgi:hypothetical protein
MNRRHVVIILACAAVIFACAPRARVSSAGDTRQPQPPHQPAVASQPAAHATTADGLAVTLTQINAAHATSFSLRVTNPGKRTEVRFPSGKTHDFVVLDDKDREVWRWSNGRLFTQALQTRQLKTGDAMHYDATWTGATPGTYHVVAMLNSETPEQIGQDFTVR